MLLSSFYLVVSGIVKVKLLADQFANHFTLYIDLPQGSSVHETKEVSSCIIHYLQHEKDITNMSVFLGESAPIDFSAMIKGRFFDKGENIANIIVNLTKQRARKESSVALVHRIRPILQKNCSLHQANIKFIQTPAGPPYLATLVLEVRGEGNYKDIKKLADTIAPLFKEVKGVEDVDVLHDSMVQRYEIQLNEKKIVESQLKIAQVKKVLYIAFEGVDIAYTNEKDEPKQIAIHLVLDDQTKESPYHKMI